MKSGEELQRTSSRKRTRAGMLVVTLGLTVSLAASPTVKPDNTVPANDSPSAKSITKRHWFQIGKASWYGGAFNGRKTANGETYDMYAMTCAHRTLPLGSWVRVTNLSNRRSTVLRVNDRGPMPMSRIVDLSYAAAKELGVEGLAKVRLEKVNPADQRLAEKMVAQLRMEDPSRLKPAGDPPTVSLLDPELVANFGR